MKNRYVYIILSLLLLTASNQASAQNHLRKEKRRIEEDKRKSLTPTEITHYPDYSGVKSTYPSPKLSELQYLRLLFDKDKASFSDALQILTILLGKQNELNDFSAQAVYLKVKGVITENMARQLGPQSPLRRGVAAYMLCRALGIKGGITFRLLRYSQRYALQELVYEEIMDPGSLQDIISGQELVSVFSNATEYLLSSLKRSPQAKLK